MSELNSDENAIILYELLMHSKKNLVNFLDNFDGKDVTQTVNFLDEKYKKFIFELSIKVIRKIENE